MGAEDLGCKMKIGTAPMIIKYMFRMPVFPVITSIDGHVIGAVTPDGLGIELSKTQFVHEEIYDLVDAVGEGWSLLVNQSIVFLSPINMRNRWTKREIIKLFNERKNTELAEGIQYSEKSLSAKRLDRIISDIAELLTQVSFQ